MLVTDVKQFAEVVDKLRKDSGLMVYDLETDGVDPFNGDRLCGVAILVVPADPQQMPESFYLPFRHRHVDKPAKGHEGVEYANLPRRCLSELAPFLADPCRVLMAYNAKFDVNMTQVEGIQVRNRQIDVMLRAHLVNENEPSFKLKDLGAKYVEPGARDAEEAMEAKAKELGFRNAKSNMHRLPPEVVAPYAEQDVWLTWRLHFYLLEELRKQKLERLAEEVDAYGQIVQQMEFNGILVDREKCRKMLGQCDHERTELELQMREHPSVVALVEAQGKPFNPRSVPQLQKVLQVKSTKRENLEEMDHPVAQALNHHRMWERAKNVYFQKYLDVMDAECRVHANLNLIGTISGRLSCSAPNLQALPRTTDIYRVKDVVVAPPGYTLASFDYSQAELRVLTYYTQDPNLLDAYRGGQDIHSQTAEATGLPRSNAKQLNFGMVYGIGIPGIQRKFGKSEAEAKRIFAAYHGRFPRVKKLYYDTQNFAKKYKFIPMWTGRRRHYGPDDEFHKASSNLIQGGVAEIMRVAITRLDAMFREAEADVRMVLQIHDDILFEIQDGEVDYWLPRIKGVMEDFDFSVGGDPDTRVPIVADCKVGKAWGTMEHRDVSPA